MVKRTVDIFMDHFDVRKCCFRLRIPVDDVFATVNEPFFVHFHEDVTDRVRQSFVQCETLFRVVETEAELRPLLANVAGIFFFPLPRFFDEFFAA